MSTPTQYAIVQHSAYATGHTQFARAVQSTAVTTAADRKKVEKAGGVLFDDYSAAEQFCELANYPAESAGDLGLIPRAQGTFSMSTVDGMAIYIPVRKVVG